MTFDSDYEPWFEPPGWIIGPIWLVLYTMLAISFTMMLAKREEISNSNLVIGLFVIQMIANLMWPNVFNSAEYLASLSTDCNHDSIYCSICVHDLHPCQRSLDASMAIHCMGQLCWSD